MGDRLVILEAVAKHHGLYAPLRVENCSDASPEICVIGKLYTSSHLSADAVRDMCSDLMHDILQVMIKQVVRLPACWLQHDSVLRLMPGCPH